MNIYPILAAKQRGFMGILVFLLLAAMTGAIFASATPKKFSPASPAAPLANAATSYGLLPLFFIPNAGQSAAGVQYLAGAMGGMLFFKQDGVALSLPSARGGGQVVDLRFEGLPATHQVVPADPLPGRVNYFIGNDSSRWLTGLPTYASILYEQLYPGIDLRYEGEQSTLKGTYTLAPQADPDRIRWRYQGATALQVDENSGDLLLTLADESILVEKAPSAWQVQNGARMSVAAGYALNADGSIGFALGSYEPNLPLTIDPLLIYSTYLGGSAFDSAKSVAVDFAGNAYITGVTHSTNFPTQTAYNGTLQGGVDAFVVKINPSGSAFVYATYLGGSNGEDENGGQRAGGIAVDSSGSAYVTGCTNSADFPITALALQVTHGGFANCDVYVTKLSTAGSSLVYSTFLGGSSVDTGNAIAVDDQGNAYIAGEAGKFYPGSSFTSSGHVFVTKINPAGSAVVFSWFFGGNGFENATDIAVDSAHNVYIVGNTYSTNFPTVNAAQPVIGGGTGAHYDAFVTKIQPDGLGLVYSTYLGGNNAEDASGIAVDNLGNAYITGLTQSLDFPTTINAYQPAYNGTVGNRSDAFVTKLNPTGDTLVYSTYLGGKGDENYFGGHGPYGGIAVDSSYRAVVTGYTCSPNFPTLGSFQIARSGTCYAFITQFKPAGNELGFSTLIGTQSGGSNDTLGTDIALDAQGLIYVVGETNATNLLTSNPLQASRAGLYDGFITKFNPNFFVFIPQIAKAPGPIASLVVSSPNGAEQWQPGTSHTITWKQTGLSGIVTLELYKGATLARQVTTASANAGSFAWAIPANQALGNDYKIRIFQGSVEDYSDTNFSIVTVRKYDLLGSWSTGVSSLNSDTSEWSLITSSSASQVEAGDVDGDGKADIFANFPASGLWVKYSATGLWQFISSPPTSFAVGDFNGDGKADLAGIWGGVIWIRDSATGSWSSGSANATLLAAGDMNGDGKADLVANFPSNGIWVQYSASGAWANLSPSPASRLAVGDFNGDGKADLAGIWSSNVWIIDTATGSVTSGPVDCTLLAAGDLNGDGKADLICNTASGVWVQYSATGGESNLTPSPATWIATGILR
jgi:hypothetical protein